jgi:hypothetical protein
MGTVDEKFRKLLAAYEDEVQRKQHRMGKRILPTDEARPNPHSGFCPFHRDGREIVWSPSFDVIGTYDPAAALWTWGWAETLLDPRARTRVEQVRTQAALWGMEALTTPVLPITSEREAWEFTIVATAILSADAMYRYFDPDGPNGDQQRFFALFEGPPPSRSASFRAIKGVGREVVDHATSGGPTYPALERFVPVARAPLVSSGRASIPGQVSPSTGRFSSIQPRGSVPPTSGSHARLSATPQPPNVGRTGRASSIPAPIPAPTPQPPNVRANPSALRTDTVPPPLPGSANTSRPSLGSSVVPMPPPLASDEREPTQATRDELGARVLKAIPLAQHSLLGVATMMARPLSSAPVGGSSTFDLRLILKPLVGSELTLSPPAQLYEVVSALWQRCLEYENAGFRFLTVRVENSQNGLVTIVTLER